MNIYKLYNIPAPRPLVICIPLLFARQSSHFICFSPSPCRLEHVCLTSLGRGSLAQFGQDHSQAERFDRGIGHGTN